MSKPKVTILYTGNNNNKSVTALNDSQIDSLKRTASTESFVHKSEITHTPKKQREGKTRQ